MKVPSASLFVSARLQSRLAVLLLSLALAWPAAATTWQLSGELHVPGASDGFGFAMDRDGDTLIVANLVQGDVGAFIFVRDGDGWALQDTLPVPTPGYFLYPVANVAVDGDTAVVGTPGVTIGGVAQVGRAYVYQRSGEQWFLAQIISHPQPTPDAHFGASVALDGDVLLVGAYGRAGNATEAGSAHVFRRDGLNFQHEQSFLSPVFCTFCRFGQAVAVSGQRLMIGQPSRARVFSYTYEGNSWVIEANLVPADGTTSGAEFGQAIQLDGDRAFIGAPSALVGGEPGGAVYVLQLQGGVWGQLQRLQSEPGAFGHALAVSGNKLIVGAPAAFGNLGRISVFETGGLSWSESQSFVEVTGQALIDGVGRSVAIDERGLVAADSRRRAADALAGDQGMAYLYRAQVPRLLAFPLTLGFGAVPVGQSSSIKPVQLLNVGQKTLQVTGLDAPAAPFIRHGGSCGDVLPIVLAPGASCTLTYRFLPQAPGAAQTGVTLSSNDPLGEQTLTLTGLGAVPALSIAPSPVNMGTVVPPDSSAPVPVTLTNAGDASLQIDAIGSASAPFARVDGTCSEVLPFVLGAGQSCTLVYEFTPVAYGEAIQEIVIASNAATSPDSFSLHGFGEGPLLSVGSADFGGVPVGGAQTATVSLFGSGVVVNNVTGIDAPEAPFVRIGGDCPEPPFQIFPDTSCTLEYQFSPASAGAHQQFLSVESDAANCPCLIELGGTGLQPVLQLTPAALDFGQVSVGDSAMLEAVVFNAGNDVLGILAIEGPSGAFTRVGGDCPIGAFALDIGKDCTLIYRFAPAQEGNHEQTLGIASNATGAPHALTLIGRSDSGIFRDGFEE